MPDDEEKLWLQYQNAPSDSVRNSLSAHYSQFVEHIARRVAKRAPECVDVSDLIQEGHIALLVCIGRFNPKKGVPFTSYAGRRVEGAMRDWMRGEDLLPDTVRRSVTALRDVISSARHDGHHNAQEISDRIDITPHQVETAINGTSGFLYDLARHRGTEYTDTSTSRFMLVTLDWCGLHAVRNPGQWFPIEISDVIEFGPIHSFEAGDRPTVFADRVFVELQLSPHLGYEWHLAQIAEECVPPVLPEKREITMTDFLERIETKINRKRMELERLEEMRTCMSDPCIADELAEILDTKPVAPKRKPRTVRSRSVTKRILLHFRNTGNAAASVHELSAATGLSIPQVRGAVANKKTKRFEKSHARSNGVIRYVMVDG